MELGKYLAIPYQYRGSAMDGADCYGLVVLWFRHELGLEVMDYKRVGADFNVLHGHPFVLDCAAQDEDFVELAPNAPLQRHDLLTFCTDGSATPNHAGIYLGNGCLLHTMQRHGCVVSRLKLWQRMLFAAYRHRSVP